MMLSVLKNTKTPVKFWFLKNYLSPTFKVCFPMKRKIFLLRKYVQYTFYYFYVVCIVFNIPFCMATLTHLHISMLIIPPEWSLLGG